MSFTKAHAGWLGGHHGNKFLITLQAPFVRTRSYLIPPSTCSWVFGGVFFSTCGGKLLLAWLPQEPVYCCFDWCTCRADVISPPRVIADVNQFTSSHTFIHTRSPIVLYLISSLIICPCDIWLLVMCYFCSRPAASVSLSILTETGQSSTPAVIQTQSQVFWLPAPSPSSSSSSSSAFMFLEPAAKRTKQHNASRPNDLNTCRLAVTAVTRLTPLLNSGRVKCRVMLHYVQRQDAPALMSNPTPAVLHCGQVILDIHSDFQTKLLKNPKLKSGKVHGFKIQIPSTLDFNFNTKC